tara:strand:+ start:123 stop:1136 length:1014 start_codon:yes stop_codon:yes gene_type:complete
MIKNIFFFIKFIKTISIYKIFIIILLYTNFNTAISNDNLDYDKWLINLRIESLKQGISPEIFDNAMKSVKIIKKINQLDAKQPEKKITFKEYLNRTVSKKRIELGKINYLKFKKQLDEISLIYKVQPRFIVAIWGIETNYGSYTGNFPVISALTTLAYKGRRSNFFRKQLIAALHILNNGNIELKNMHGSWAGAMGQSQFMPTSYLKYAQDFDNDGKKDIWNNKLDIFASIAFYLKSHGWDNNRTWGREVIVPDSLLKNKDFLNLKNKTLKFWSDKNILMLNRNKLPKINLKANIIIPDSTSNKTFLIYNNYTKIKKYNNSNYYALSVGILSDRIAN